MRLSLFLLISLFAFNTQASVAAVETYLTELKTMVADFKQLAPDGTISTGKFQLKRPKQMRWQYNPPTPILMVTRDDYLTYYDYELNQVSDIPLDDTLLGILSRQDIDFENSNIIVSEHFEEEGFITVTLEQKDSPEQGSLGMVFKTDPMQLTHLVVTDTTQLVTQITLSNIEQGVTLEDAVFNFSDPRIGGKNKKSDRFGSESIQEKTPEE
ncbi:MAG: outer membrane lipoprotein carrier protein LolA [Rickettsiales bacterium]|nr:outer membrane lipoprotein carrier protein LolA [Rickettsiales bacterium]